MLADAIVCVHLAVVLFVIAGLPLIYIGAARRWAWVRGVRWRAVHLATVVLIAAESLVGIACPLTVWEDALRGHRPAAGFIERWVDRILFYDFPPWVFVLAYTVFAVCAAVTWVTVPPTGTRRHRKFAGPSG
jgi:hypothetical protein